jgi:cyclophilin family peptidyl-prolyl cis-trans isomerase
MKPLACLLALSITAASLTAQDAPPAAADAAANALKAAQESEELQKIADKALKAAGESSSPLATKAKGAAAAASKALPSSKTPTKTAIPKAAPLPPGVDPATWGKDEIHKLAVMEVDYGGNDETIVFHLLERDAPAHTANFIENCENKAYNDLAIHRAIDGYLVQTGDPLTADQSKRNDWGTGGEEKTVPPEIKAKHRVGAVAMARRSDRVNPSRRSNGYQFYFALGNLSALDGTYTVFGQVVSGLEVLESISRAPADSNDCPLARIEVKSIKIVDQKGPLIVMKSQGGGSRATKPASAKNGWERFLERVW